QHLELAPGMDMGGFHSNSLNRTFDQIVFSTGPLQKNDGVPAGNLSPGHGSIQQPPAAPAEAIKVEKAPGKNTYTVAELHGMRTKLSGKKVLVRGKVVKVSQGIMGRNWVHLQDGSGSTTDGSNDIVITTGETPTVGSLVTMTGTLATDRDFGGGYRYKAIVEEGSIKK
ncbi:MAG TPA: DNA-binding protein, partial [Geobacterales bacterium]|nr:DNA-binding protein [Geobacterales bacterium]